MLGLGRYSQHRKLKTEPENGDHFDTDLGSPDENDYTVLYLGEDQTKTCNEKNYSDIVGKIYGQTFSPLNAMIQSKKLSLRVCDTGVVVSTPGKHETKRLFKDFSVPNLVYLSSDNNHKKVLAIVSRKSSGNTSLSVFVCEEDTAPTAIMEECIQKINREKNSRKIVNITKSNYPAAINIIYEDLNQSVNLPQRPLDFGEFTSNIEPIHQAIQSPDSNTDFDLDDEFSQLALKRNNAMPEHLQDKTVESACLIQDNTHEQQISPLSKQPEPNMFFKTNFFSSYSRVSSGSS